MNLKLLFVLGALSISTSSFASSIENETTMDSEQNQRKVLNKKAHTGHKNMDSCTRQGVEMLMELDKYLAIPFEDRNERARFMQESSVLSKITNQEKKYFLTLTSKKDEGIMTSAKVKRVFAESILKRCKK